MTTPAEWRGRAAGRRRARRRGAVVDGADRVALIVVDAVGENQIAVGAGATRVGVSATGSATRLVTRCRTSTACSSAPRSRSPPSRWSSRRRRRSGCRACSTRPRRSPVSRAAGPRPGLRGPLLTRTSRAGRPHRSRPDRCAGGRARGTDGGGGSSRSAGRVRWWSSPGAWSSTCRRARPRCATPPARGTRSTACSPPSSPRASPGCSTPHGRRTRRPHCRCATSGRVPGCRPRMRSLDRCELRRFRRNGSTVSALVRV